MDLPFCKICGERHAKGFCPEFAEFEPSKQPEKFVAAPPRLASCDAPGERPAEVGGANPPSPSRRPFRRPLDKDRGASLAQTRPWQREGMSRATWFRRQHEQA